MHAAWTYPLLGASLAIRGCALPFALTVLFHCAGGHAASFTWKLGSGTTDTNNWNLNKNWTAANGPPGSSDAAVFSTGGSLTPTLTANTAVTSLTFDSSAPAYTVGGAFVLGIGSGGVTNNSPNQQSLNVAMSLNAPQTWNIASAGVIVNGIISGSGAWTKIGAGTLTLSGPNTFSGGLTINAGVVAVSSDGNLGSGGLAFGGGTLRTDAGITSGRNITLNSGGGTIDNNGFNSTFSGVISGAGSLTKNGAGTLTLSGNNNYTGNTIVNSGVLLANSAAALQNTAGLQINAGTLRLGAAQSFTAPPPVTLAGGTLDANDQSAVFGSLILNANSTIQLNSASAPSIALTFASASASGGAILTINGWSTASDRDKIFITGSAPQTFLDAVRFTGFNAGALVTDGELAPVPEPVESTLIAGASLVLFYFGRRMLARR